MDKNLGILTRILKSANMRQKVIASNIANSDTPGYRAKRIKFGSFLENEMKLAATDPRHISGKGSGGISATISTDGNLPWGDGNNVDMNSEVASMTDNSLRYEAAIKILNSKISMYKKAIKGR